MTWFIVAMTPLPMSFLITSTGLTCRRSARSLTEIAGGSTTLRSPFTCGSRTAVVRPNWLRAASIARGGSGAAAFRVSLLIFRKFNSSLWLMLSSRASSCAFMTRVSDYDRSVRPRNPALSGYESQGLFCQTGIAGGAANQLSPAPVGGVPGEAGGGGGKDSPPRQSGEYLAKPGEGVSSRNCSSKRARRRDHRRRRQCGHDRHPLKHAGVAQVVVEHGA